MKASLLCLLVVVAAVCWATPLDDYVNAPDPTYTYNLVSQMRGLNFNAYFINLTSQTWLTAADSSQPVWYHWLTICVPDTIQPNYHTSAVYINGGGNSNNPPGELDPAVEILCVSSQTVVANLDQIPNEPIIFPTDPLKKRRTEDAIIAFTWAHFMNNTNEPNWLLRLPMTKAVVRAMDTVQSFTYNMPNVPKITNFVVAGASKRGWTTWTTGIVDKRVTAMIPIVIPVLNMVPNFNRMFQMYGAWSFALQDYLDMHVMNYLNQPEMAKLAAIIDPLSYNSRLVNMPKYLICAGGDEFFLPDSANSFWDMLLGPKWLRIVPDAEHSLAGQQIDVALAAETFYKIHLDQLQAPQWTWNLVYSNDTASITATIPAQKDAQLVGVYVWWAQTLSTVYRDFRLLTCASPECVNPVIWHYEALPVSSNGIYTYSMKKPWWGWTGFLLEAVFAYNYPNDPLNPTRQIRLTTEVNVVPAILPFPPCGMHCQPPTPSGAAGRAERPKIIKKRF